MRLSYHPRFDLDRFTCVFFALLRFCVFAFNFLCLTSFLVANEAKVLLVMPNKFIREAIAQKLLIEGYRNVIQESVETLDTSSGQIAHLIAKTEPDYVIVDGSSDSALETLLIDTSVINAAMELPKTKVFVLSSFTVYPLKNPLPFQEENLLKIKIDKLEDPWQIAKLSALKLCSSHNGLKVPRAFFCTYPYLCGPHDTGFQIRAEHPLKNISSRILKAKLQKKDFTVVSNDGEAQYEFIHVDDLASALIFLFQAPNEDMIINIGYGRDTNIRTLAQYVKGHLNFEGNLIFDVTSYDVVPRLVLDTRRLSRLGWVPSYTTQDAIKDTVQWLESKAPEYDPLEEKELILP